jgi:hypothetical protein
MNKSWKVVLAFAGVFLAGAIFGGALAPHLKRFERLQPRPPLAERMMQRFDEQLQLTAEQKPKVRPIVDRMSEETLRMRRESSVAFRAMMDRMTAELARELTPEQRVKLDEMRAYYRERAEQRNRGR